MSEIWVSAPFNGMSSEIPFWDMPEGFAEEVYNFYCKNYYLEYRRGFKRKNYNMGSGDVKTVKTLSKQAGGQELIAMANNKIYDLSTSSATDLTGALTISTTDTWRGFEFNQNLILMNGTNPIIKVNSTPTAAAAGYTGPSSADSTLIQGFGHKELPYFVEKDSMSYWYSATTGALSGALVEVDLSSVFDKGGFLVAGASVQMRPGFENDNVAVFITSEGEMAIYSGLNPAALDWILIGKVSVPKPLGRECFVSLGSDTVLLSKRGALSVRSLIESPGQKPDYSSISANITDLITSNAGVQSFDWSDPDDDWIGVEDANQSRFFIKRRGDRFLYVMNTDNGAWSKIDITGASQGTRALAMFGNTLLMGSEVGTVIQEKVDGDTDEYLDDNFSSGSSGAVNYPGYATHGWFSFGSPGLQKEINAVEVLSYWAQSSYDATIRLKADFDESGSNTEGYTRVNVSSLPSDTGFVRHDAGRTGKWLQMRFATSNINGSGNYPLNDLFYYGSNVFFETGGTE